MHKNLTGDVNEKNAVLLIYGKTPQKVNLPTILIHNITKNIKVPVDNWQTAQKYNLLKCLAGKINKKVEVLLIIGKTVSNFVA